MTGQCPVTPSSCLTGSWASVRTPVTEPHTSLAGAPSTPQALGGPASWMTPSETVGPSWSLYYPASLCCSWRSAPCGQPGSQRRGGGLHRNSWGQAGGTRLLQEAHRNSGLAEDRVQGFINPPTSRQMCPSSSDLAPPWSPCQPAYVATVPEVQHAFLLGTHTPTEHSAPCVPSPR